MKVPEVGGSRGRGQQSDQFTHPVVTGGYEHHEGVSNYPILFVPSYMYVESRRSEFWLKTRLIRKLHVRTYFVKKPAGGHYHSRQALGNPY